MKRYRVTAHLTISVFVDVVAESVSEAKDLALDSSVKSLCHQCASATDGEWSTSGELDGDPEIVGVKALP